MEKRNNGSVSGYIFVSNPVLFAVYNITFAASKILTVYGRLS
jgi:hypothetical protein